MQMRMGHGILWKTILVVFFLMGCARVSIDSKDPIRLDVTMRLDVYQHVAGDAQAIEDMVASPKTQPEASANKMSFLGIGQSIAWAEDTTDYPANILEAIERRRDRKHALDVWESKGVLGENRMGFVVVKDAAAADMSALSLVSEENNDRQIIYQYIARKNGASVDETGKVFAERIQAAAPAGTPVESGSGWTIK